MEHATLQKNLRSFKQVQVDRLTGENPELAVAYKHYILFFGSKLSTWNQWNEDCVIFDTQKKTISHIATGLYFKERSGYSLCHWKDNIFVFYGEAKERRRGGLRANPQPYTPEFDVSLLKVVETGDTVTVEKEHLNTSHSQHFSQGPHHVQIHENNLYVLTEGIDRQTMELWRFSLNERSWRKCEMTGEVPTQGVQEGRRLGSVTFGDKIYVFFGRGKHQQGVLFENRYDLFTVDMESLKWEKAHKSFFEVTHEDTFLATQMPVLI